MNALKGIWQAMDGKKMITGILVCVLTAVVKGAQVKFPQLFGVVHITDEMILTAAAAGAALIVGGGAHKAVKANAKKNGGGK